MIFFPGAKLAVIPFVTGMAGQIYGKIVHKFPSIINIKSYFISIFVKNITLYLLMFIN